MKKTYNDTQSLVGTRSGAVVVSIDLTDEDRIELVYGHAAARLLAQRLFAAAEQLDPLPFPLKEEKK